MSLTKCVANDGYSAYSLCPGAVLTKFRDGLGLSNDNAMSQNQFVEQIEKILKEDYRRGDIIFFQKNELIINP